MLEQNVTEISFLVHQTFIENLYIIIYSNFVNCFVLKLLCDKKEYIIINLKSGNFD